MVAPGDFYRESHGVIYEVIKTLYDRTEPVDLITVTTEIRNRKLIDIVGGVKYLNRLVDNMPTGVNMPHYARMVKDASIRRSVTAQLAATIGKIQDAGNHDLLKALEQAGKAIVDAQVLSRRTRTMVDFENDPHAVCPASEVLAHLIKTEGPTKYITTGYEALDDILGGHGFSEGSYSVLSGARGHGKTELAMSMARRMAEAGVKIQIFSLENSTKKVLGHMSEIREGLKNIYTMKKTTRNMDMIIDKIREGRARFGVQFVVIDNLLQIVNRGEVARGRGNASFFLGDLTQKLKDLCNETGVVVLLLSHITADETRSGGEPSDGASRDSGFIEMDADCVWYIWRDADGKGYLKLAKSREEGRFGRWALDFRGHAIGFEIGREITADEMKSRLKRRI
jgi:replicative DNA helicase